MATVVNPYRKLEDGGHIEARPRSGFFVRARRAIQTIESVPSSDTAPPRPLTGQEMAMALIKAANDPGIVQLGAAVPDPDYLPTQAVSRALARVARLERSRAAGYMMPPAHPSCAVRSHGA